MKKERTAEGKETLRIWEDYRRHNFAQSLNTEYFVGGIARLGNAICIQRQRVSWTQVYGLCGIIYILAHTQNKPACIQSAHASCLSLIV